MHLGSHSPPVPCGIFLLHNLLIQPSHICGTGRSSVEVGIYRIDDGHYYSISKKKKKKKKKNKKKKKKKIDNKR